MYDKSRNTWLCVHWQWNTLEWSQLNALQASPVVHLVSPLLCVSLSMNTQPSVPTLWTCFMHLGIYPQLLWNLSEKLCFEPSQIATVTNCDTIVAICDLSQFVNKAMTSQTESNNTENVFWVLERVPRFTFDMNMKSCIFTHFGVISLVYLFVVMYISYKAHNRCTQETFLKGSDFDVNMFYALRSIPSVTMKSIWEVVFWNVHIATVTNCDTIVAICDLSQFVIKAMTAQTESNNTENVFWVLERVPRFTFDMNMKSCIFTHFGVISLVYLFVVMYISYKAHNRCTQETFLKGSDFDVNMFYALRSILSVTMKTIWEVVFWTVTNCNSHKLRHYRRNLWFVAICDQGRDGTNGVQ